MTTSEPYREMACMACGCLWNVRGDQMTQRPPCPECGGPYKTGRHMRSFYGDRLPSVVPGNAFCEGTCEPTSVCTTQARDTFSMAYQEHGMAAVGVPLPNYHEWVMPPASKEGHDA